MIKMVQARRFGRKKNRRCYCIFKEKAMDINMPAGMSFRSCVTIFSGIFSFGIDPEVMRSYLDFGSIHSIQVEDARAALELLKQANLLRCLLLNIMMPGISRLNIATKLHKHTLYQSCQYYLLLREYPQEI